MKKILFTLCVPLFAEYTQAQIVTIPDVNFKNALIERGVDTNHDSLIQVSEALAVKALEVFNRSITSLTGIEAFTNLTSLSCDTNNLASLDVHTNTLLDTLNCNNNKILALDISMLPNLTRLNCSSNKFTTFSSSANVALKWFDIGGNISITTLDLTHNVNLEHLDIVLCSKLSSLDISQNLKLSNLLAIQTNKLLVLDVSNNTALTTLLVGPNFLPKPAMTIYVNATQKAAIPSGWMKNASDTYVLKSAVGIEELSAPTVAKKVVHVYNLEGQEVNINDTNVGVFIYEYNDGSVKKIGKF